MSEIQNGRLQIPETEPIPEQTAGEIQRLLAANLGKEVVAEFSIGLEELEEKAGVLRAVSADYLVLYDDVNLVDIVCDFRYLRFITFYLPGARPGALNSENERTAQENESQGGEMRGQAREVSAANLAALNYAKRKARKLE